MGSRKFYHEIYGVNAREAFEYLVKDAVEKYGNNSYSGTIATKRNFIMLEVPKRKSLEQFIQEESDKVSKFDAALCIEIPKQRKTNINVPNGVTVKKHKSESRKWETEYRVAASFYGTEGELIATCKTQTEANKIAKEKAAEGIATLVIINKKLVTGNKVITTFEPKFKLVPTNESKFIFFGLANE